MKKNFLLDYCLYLTVKSLSFLVKFIPIELSLILAGFIGRMAYYLFRKKRDLACKNLKIAFGQYSSLEIKQIVKKAFIHTLQHLVEILYLPWMDDKYIKKYIDFEGIGQVKDLISNKKGVIFLALHLGSWEVGNVVLARVFADYNYIGLARTQTNTPLLDGLINSFRQKRNCRIVKVSDSFRPLIEHLKKGYALAMVADHGAQGGEVVDFLGRDTLTPSGGLKLALKLDTNVVVGFLKRIKGPYHKLSIQPYILTRTSDESRDLKINMENVNHLYARYIKEDPAQYLWFFKRWKHSPQRNVLILSDGKAGHLRQSQALAELVGDLGFQVKLDILEVKFKNKIERFIFELLGLFCGKNAKIRIWCLERFLDKDLYEKINSCYYDLVVSSGAGLAVLNYLISCENMSKSVVIMRPGIFSFKRFDLVVACEHDNPKKYKNVVSIKGSLCYTGNNLEVEKLTRNYNLVPSNFIHPVIGVLVGGNNRFLNLDIGIIEKVSACLEKISVEFNADLLISTSRRTAKDVEQFLKKKFAHYPRCRFLVIASEFNPKGAVEAIFKLSDILVVSMDSISMMCEAIESGKSVISFNLEKKPFVFGVKHERFMRGLEEGKHIQITKAQDLYEKIKGVYLNKPTHNPLNNRKIVRERLKKLL